MKLTTRWPELPRDLRDHLQDRVRDRCITIHDLQKLQLWLATNPDVPECDWYKDFGSFILCGSGRYPKTFLQADQEPWGEPL